MLQVEFEPTNPVFERAKTVHALDRAATVTSGDNCWCRYNEGNVIVSSM
jgi:hypothetical protein